MNPYQAIQVLNDLLTVLHHSLPAYLNDARPWVNDCDRRLCEMLDRLAADQERYACRVAEAIVACGGRPDPGRFPDAFEAKNDLALDYLWNQVIARQEKSIPVIERCAAALEGEAALHVLAEEILGNAKGHLDLLKGDVKGSS